MSLRKLVEGQSNGFIRTWRLSRSLGMVAKPQRLHKDCTKMLKIAGSACVAIFFYQISSQPFERILVVRCTD